MKEYTEKEALREAMRLVTDDPTCPLHIAATIDQYITEAPVVQVDDGDLMNFSEANKWIKDY